MRLILITLCLLIFSIPTFAQEIFGGINFGNSKKFVLGNDNHNQYMIIESEWDILWKNKKRQLLYNGLNLKFGINSGDGYKIGLGYKTVFGIDYDEEDKQHNIGIESTIGFSYRPAAAYTEIANYGFALDYSLGIRFKLFQNYGAKIMYNLSYKYYNEIEIANYEQGFSIGFVGPVWVNKKSIFKRRKALKIQQGE